MPRTCQCKSCGAILNLPDAVKAGKRLRCPKCGLRFVVTVEDAASESTLSAPLDAEATVSGFEIEKLSLRREEPPLPVADRDLRETFDLPLMSGRDAERQGAAAAPAMGDAAALFQDRGGETRRRPAAGDARTRARRCSRCGGLVPQGMSVCVSCGVDQETGMRVGLEDDLAPPPPPAPSGPPLHVAIVGGFLGVGALILLILALMNSVGGAEGVQNYGWLCLAVAAGFGMFAVVQFVRLKTAKLLLVALTLGVVINVMTLIAMPLVQANWETDETVQTVPSDDPDDSGVQIKPFEERLNTQRISLGITFLVLYAILALYLMSPAVKKPLQRANLTSL
jgi:DNA-directed RNA polymerase subunit RPC12/RpoP